MTAGLTNTGLVSVDNANANEGGSSLTLGGALTNSGTLNVGPGNATLSAPVTVTTTALSNTGAINLTGSAVDPRTLQAQLAEINVTGGVAGFGTAGSVTGQVNLSQGRADPIPERANHHDCRQQPAVAQRRGRLHRRRGRNDGQQCLDRPHEQRRQLLSAERRVRHHNDEPHQQRSPQRRQRVRQ